MRARFPMIAAPAIALMLSGCGKSGSTSGAATEGRKPDVTVKVDGARHKCMVTLAGEANGSSVACDDVVSFVREELRVPSGSIVDIAAVAGAADVETTKVRAAFDGAGYHPRD